MIDLSKKVVYLAAPKRLFDSYLFAQAYQYLLLKTASLLDSRGMYTSNQDWLENFETRLSICDTMIIVSDDMLVGKGVYKEFNYFRNRFCKAYHIFPSQPTTNFYLMEIKSLKIVDDDDWRDYATIQYR